jgi:putative DNA-invertase from lambdoid prophage Rac
MTVYGYTRVSTARQASEGESLEVQQRAITGYAMIHGATVAHIYKEEGVSGSVPLHEREQGARLLGVLQSGDMIVTAKLDRMFRSASDALSVLDGLKRRGVSLHMIDLGGDVTGSGISKLLFTILSAVAEAERDRIRERISQVKSDQRDRARYLGGKVPYGYERDGSGGIVPSDTHDDIARIHAMRQAGHTFRAIQDALRRDGVAPSIAAIHRIAGRTR